MTNKDKRNSSGDKEPAPKPDVGRVQERQEEQRQRDKGRDIKPGGRNDDQSKQSGHH